MRVAYLIPGLQPGGWRTHAQGFIHAISKYVEPILFVSSADDASAKQLFPRCEIVTLQTIQRASFTLSHLRELAAAYRAITRRKDATIELVHSLEAYPTGLIGSWLAATLRKPHVLTAHGTYSILPYRSTLDRLAYKRVLRKASALCPVSHGTADLIRQYFSDAVANLYMQPILNGNDYYKAIPRQDVLQHQQSAVPTLLSVGTVKPRKGHHISLQAFAQLKKKVPSARYWIVGSISKKKYYRRLQHLISAYQLEGIEFLGAVSAERLQQCYREASALLVAAQQVDLHFEGFGLVCLEAGAFGVPVIGTSSGGVADAVRHGETGLVVDPDDVEGLARAMGCLLTDPELARRMGLANRDWAETLTWERYAREQYQVYENILA